MRKRNPVPYKKLREGFELALRNVGFLIETANLLHDRRRFLHSTIFSVTAIEETVKAQILKDYYDRKNDLSMEEWERITKGKAHWEKIGYFVTAAVKSSGFMKSPSEQVVRHFTKLIDGLTEYNVRIRTHVLYLNWDKEHCKWEWYPQSYTEKQQEDMSLSLLLTARTAFEKHQAG